MRDPDPTIGQRPARKRDGRLFLARYVAWCLFLGACISGLIFSAPYLAARGWTAGVKDAWGESTCYSEDVE
jgi:hypothetical protein